MFLSSNRQTIFLCFLEHKNPIRIWISSLDFIYSMMNDIYSFSKDAKMKQSIFSIRIYRNLKDKVRDRSSFLSSWIPMHFRRGNSLRFFDPFQRTTLYQIRRWFNPYKTLSNITWYRFSTVNLRSRCFSKRNVRSIG